MILASIGLKRRASPKVSVFQLGLSSGRTAADLKDNATCPLHLTPNQVLAISSVALE
jgi:hypothetical protein